MSDAHKKCSGECGKDCPCENPRVQRALVKLLLDKKEPLTLKEAHEAMTACFCPRCREWMPQLLFDTHRCT